MRKTSIKVNQKNDRQLCTDLSEVPMAMHTTFLEVVSNKENVMTPHLFPQGLRINASVYTVVLERVCNRW